MRSTQSIACVASLLAASCASSQGIPEGYTLVELVPLGGGTESVVSALNDRGQIVGRTEFSTGPIATSWDATGAAALVTTSGNTATDALSINNEGSMLVECAGCTNDFGVRLTDGVLLELLDVMSPGFVEVAPKLNAAGAVGGLLRFDPGTSGAETYSVIWELAPGPQMIPNVSPNPIRPPGFLPFYSDGILSDTGAQVFGSSDGTGGAPGFLVVDRRTESSAFISGGQDGHRVYDVNASGQFVGSEGGGAEEFSYLFGESIVRIDPIGCADFANPIECYFEEFFAVLPAAVNDRALVVGNATVVNDDGTGFPTVTDVSGFLWTESAGSVDLISLIDDGTGTGWEFIQGSSPFDAIGPVDINEQGWIVGNGINPNGDPAAYLLIPRSPCAGDTNRDGDVTPADFSAWIQAFNNGCD